MKSNKTTISPSDFVKQNTTNRTPFAYIHFNFNNNRSESYITYTKNQITSLINKLKSIPSLYSDLKQILIIQLTTNPTIKLITAEYKFVNNKLINTISNPIPLFDSPTSNSLIPIISKLNPTDSDNTEITDLFHR